MLTNEPVSPGTDPEPSGWHVDLCGLGLPWPGRLWVAGAHAPGGVALDLLVREGAWVLDCAGMVRRRWEPHALRFAQWVFEDLERVPPRFERLLALCRTWADDLVRELPPHVIVACTHGLNRSALVAGIILRELGVPGEEAMRRIRAARPGALNNRTFEALLLSSL